MPYALRRTCQSCSRTFETTMETGTPWPSTCPSCSHSPTNKQAGFGELLRKAAHARSGARTDHEAALYYAEFGILDD